MSQLTRNSLTAMMLLLLAAAAAAATAAMAGSSCQEDTGVLNTTCYEYVKKSALIVLPSQQCCDAVKGVDVLCVCRYLGTPGIKDNMSMEKVFYLTQQCSISIPGNCGGEKLDLVNNLHMN